MPLSRSVFQASLEKGKQGCGVKCVLFKHENQRSGFQLLYEWTVKAHINVSILNTETEDPQQAGQLDQLNWQILGTSENFASIYLVKSNGGRHLMPTSNLHLYVYTQLRERTFPGMYETLSYITSTGKEIKINELTKQPEVYTCTVFIKGAH